MNMTKRNNPPCDDLQIGSVSVLGILAASLALRLTPDELEWLCRDLEVRAEEKRLEAGGEERVLAGYRDAWEPERDCA
jgi:hypothetical protein